MEELRAGVQEILGRASGDAMKGSDRISTPPEEPAPDEAGSTREGNRESDLSVDPAKLFPERMSDVFSDPAPGAGK
jgi:hypothetical protein